MKDIDADGGDDSDRARNELLAELHAHLRATEELPVRPEVNRWLGEAQAVAADAADGEAPPAAVERRVEQVRDLLEHVDETGDPTADERVRAAIGVVDALGELFDRGG